jgi:hypothetical protein
MKCEADGEPSPSIQWLKDDLPIEKAKRPIHLRPYFERPGNIFIRELKENSEFFINALTFSYCLLTTVPHYSLYFVLSH